MDNLTKKQTIFISEYLSDMNATRAAKAAGYSEKTAYSHGQRLLKNVEVQKVIDEQSKERLNHLNITSMSILQDISDIKDKCKDSEPKTALRALELLGKHLGMWKERLEIKQEGHQESIEDYLRRI